MADVFNIPNRTIIKMRDIKGMDCEKDGPLCEETGYQRASKHKRRKCGDCNFQFQAQEMIASAVSVKPAIGRLNQAPFSSSFHYLCVTAFRITFTTVKTKSITSEVANYRLKMIDIKMLDDFKGAEKVKTPATLVVTKQLYLKADAFATAAILFTITVC